METAKDLANKAAATLTQAKDAVVNTATEAANKASEAAKSAANTASETASQVGVHWVPCILSSRELSVMLLVMRMLTMCGETKAECMALSVSVLHAGAACMEGMHDEDVGGLPAQKQLCGMTNACSRKPLPSALITPSLCTKPPLPVSLH